MYTLSNKTRLELNKYLTQLSRLNNVENCSAPFDVAPNIEQKLVERYQKVTDFLSKINIIPVKMGHGEKLGLGANKTVASTTDTRVQPRRPTNLFDLEGIDEYLCTQTDFDVALDWRVIDNWGYLSDFQKKLANLAIVSIAQDKQRIGFNGTHRAKTSNRDIYKNLEDVNIGWLEKMRAYNEERYLDGMVIGANQEFKNLDALVEMAIHELIGEEHRNANDLVVITNTGMVMDKYQNLMNQALPPTEQAAANALYQKKQLGTLSVDTPSFMTANGLLITSYDNLSIYQQKGTMRRYLKDEPEWNRTTDYQSVNECYVVEDYSKAVLFDNLTIEE